MIENGAVGTNDGIHRGKQSEKLPILNIKNVKNSLFSFFPNLIWYAWSTRNLVAAREVQIWNVIIFWFQGVDCCFVVLYFAYFIFLLLCYECIIGSAIRKRKLFWFAVSFFLLWSFSTLLCFFQCLSHHIMCVNEVHATTIHPQEKNNDHFWLVAIRLVKCCEWFVQRGGNTSVYHNWKKCLYEGCGPKMTEKRYKGYSMYENTYKSI